MSLKELYDLCENPTYRYFRCQDIILDTDDGPKPHEEVIIFQCIDSNLEDEDSIEDVLADKISNHVGYTVESFTYEEVFN